jgi:hypothetical protein
MQPSSNLRLRRTSLCRVLAAITFGSRERSFRMKPHLPPAWPTAAAGPLSNTSTCLPQCGDAVRQADLQHASGRDQTVFALTGDM